MSEAFAAKAVIITGAGRGLGRGITVEISAAGANVTIGAQTMSYADEGPLAMGGRENCTVGALPVLGKDADVSPRVGLGGLKSEILGRYYQEQK